MQSKFEYIFNYIYLYTHAHTQLDLIAGSTLLATVEQLAFDVLRPVNNITTPNLGVLL